MVAEIAPEPATISVMRRSISAVVAPGVTWAAMSSRIVAATRPARRIPAKSPGS
jgi:hypothetical protein